VDSQKLNLRLGVLVSHPIQYYSPWFRDLSERLHTDVFYSHRQDSAGQAAAGFGVAFEWDTPLLDGYSYRWLKNVAKSPCISGFWGCDNPELSEIIDRGRYDAFLIFGWNRKSSWQAMRACWRNGTPILMRGDSHLGGSSRAKNLIKKLPYSMFLKRIDGHLYPGAHSRRYLEYFGVGEQQLFWCPHFVDNVRFSSAAHAAREDHTADHLRARLGIPLDAFVALYVGKLIDVKRPQDFIASMVKLAKADRSFHAIVVGAGPLQGVCAEMASACAEQIHFVGFINQSGLPAYYAASNCLVLPGIETWGLVVNEAMACGIPCVVSTSCGCAGELVVPNHTGETFPVGDLDSLAAAIIRLRQTLQRSTTVVSEQLQKKSELYSIGTASECLINSMQKFK
jgi:glycosyltransferase involved in cell wall biosynthesis